MPWPRFVCNALVGLSLGLVVFLGVSPPAEASLFLAMTPEELIEQSDAVVQGRVIHQQSRWDEQGRLIVTEATVRVDEFIVGKGPPVLKVRTFGGEVDGFHVEAVGFPRFNDGEEVILFLKRDEEIQASRIVGYQQGHFEVVERLDGVVLAVPRVEDGAGFFTPSGQFVPAPPSTELGTFKQRVRAEAARLGRSTN
jgi:hypothetical protein